ncbi:bifunctional chorismate mutase/prephenate dehydratase, partial [Pseudoalteromonas sp. S327]|uniref:prephenate dehydratase domain-containing protein n=1 Tax=Pseudoalteromonas sp. S327 TaxID=579535 RepID=UPI00127CE9C3
QDAQGSLVGEVTHRVAHSLLATPDTELSQLTKIYAHPQPVAQCSSVLQGLGVFQPETCDATSSALQSALNTPYSAAIGSAPGGHN